MNKQIFISAIIVVLAVLVTYFICNKMSYERALQIVINAKGRDPESVRSLEKEFVIAGAKGLVKGEASFDYKGSSYSTSTFSKINF